MSPKGGNTRKGLWALGGLFDRLGGRLGETGDALMTTSGGEAVGKPGVATREPGFTKPWEV